MRSAPFLATFSIFFFFVRRTELEHTRAACFADWPWHGPHPGHHPRKRQVTAGKLQFESATTALSQGKRDDMPIPSMSATAFTDHETRRKHRNTHLSFYTKTRNTRAEAGCTRVVTRKAAMRKGTLSFGKRGEKNDDNKNSPSLPRKLKKGDTGIEKQFDDLLVRTGAV